MGDPNEIYLCNFKTERRSRCEFSTDLVFDPKQNRFTVRRSQDYETQAKIEFSYCEPDSYLEKPEYREKARAAIEDYRGKHPEHKAGIDKAIARLKDF